MPLPERKKEKKVTYQDYLTWPDEERWEIINGEAWAMTPAPSIRHQKIVGHTDDELVDRFLLENELFRGPDTFNWNEKISLGLFPDLAIPLWEIFEKTLPKKVRE